MVRKQLGSLVLCVSVIGCGGGDKGNETASIAKALSHVTEGQEKAKVLADEKAFNKLKEKAAEEAAEARKAELDKLLAIPEAGGTDLETACAQVAEGLDNFKRTRLQGDEAALVRWDALKGRDLENLQQSCRDSGNLKVALCKSNAMRTAPMTFGVDDAERILLACEDRYANEVARVGN